MCAHTIHVDEYIKFIVFDGVCVYFVDSFTGCARSIFVIYVVVLVYNKRVYFVYFFLSNKFYDLQRNSTVEKRRGHELAYVEFEFFLFVLALFSARLNLIG